MLGVEYAHFMYIARVPQLRAPERRCYIWLALVTTLPPNGTDEKLYILLTQRTTGFITNITINSHYFPVRYSPICFYSEDAQIIYVRKELKRRGPLELMLVQMPLITAIWGQTGVTPAVCKHLHR